MLTLYTILQYWPVQESTYVRAPYLLPLLSSPALPLLLSLFMYSSSCASHPEFVNSRLSPLSGRRKRYGDESGIGIRALQDRPSHRDQEQGINPIK